MSPSTFPKVPKGSRKQISKQGSQEQVSKQGSKEQVPKQGSHARFPRIGVQEQVPRNRFPGTGSEARLQSKSSEAKLPGTDLKQGVQAQVSKQSFCCSRQMVNKRFISVYIKQLSNIIPTNFCWLFHVVVAVGDILWCYFLYLVV